MSVTKTLCIQGVSIISFEDAIKTAFEETSLSIDHIFQVEVVGLKCNIRENRIYEYIADTKISFKIDLERTKDHETHWDKKRL